MTSNSGSSKTIDDSLSVEEADEMPMKTIKSKIKSFDKKENSNISASDNASNINKNVEGDAEEYSTPLENVDVSEKSSEHNSTGENSEASETKNKKKWMIGSNNEINIDNEISNLSENETCLSGIIVGLIDMITSMLRDLSDTFTHTLLRDAIPVDNFLIMSNHPNPNIRTSIVRVCKT